MKSLVTLLLFPALSASVVHAQDAAYLDQVQTLDRTIETLYGVISGEAGVERDWDLFRYLFKPGARLIPSGKNQEGAIGLRYMTPDDYVASSGKWLEENGFFEKEIHRETDTFGNLTHAFSTYESYRTAKDTEPFARGINSIQLLHDGRRWWIVNIYWTAETPENPIPERYLPTN